MMTAQNPPVRPKGALVRPMSQVGGSRRAFCMQFTSRKYRRSLTTMEVLGVDCSTGANAILEARDAG